MDMIIVIVLIAIAVLLLLVGLAPRLKKYQVVIRKVEPRKRKPARSAKKKRKSV